MVTLNPEDLGYSVNAQPDFPAFHIYYYYPAGGVAFARRQVELNPGVDNRKDIAPQVSYPFYIGRGLRNNRYVGRADDLLHVHNIDSEAFPLEIEGDQLHLILN